MTEHGFFSLKSLSNLLLTNDCYTTDDISVKDVDHAFTSKNLSKIKDAMRRIICMIQRDTQCEEFFNSVLRLSDTRDYELKEMINWYFLNYMKAINYDNLFSMCTNTILKDLNDRNEKIRQCAVRFLIGINSIAHFSNFARAMSKILKDGNEITKCLVLKLFENFVEKEPDFIVNYDFVSDVVCLLNSSSVQVFLHSLRCINIHTVKFVKMELVTSFVTRIKTMGTNEMAIKSTSAAVDFLINNQTEINTTDTILFVDILVEMLTFSFYIAYYASLAILNIQPEKYQLVFDKLTAFLYIKNEEKIFLLRLLYEIIKNHPVLYTNEHFVILESERNEIKILKMEILKLKPDSIATREIENLKNTELIIDVLDFCMGNGIYNKEIYSACLDREYEKLKKLICYHKPSTEEWKIEIATNFEMRDMSEETLFIVSNYFYTVPMIDTSDFSSFIRYYTTFYMRDVIDHDRLKEIFCEFGIKNSALKNEADQVLRMIRSNRTNVLQYCQYEVFGRVCKCEDLHINQNTGKIDKMRPFIDEAINEKYNEDKEIQSIRSNYSLIQIGQSPKDKTIEENRITLKSITNICFTAKVILKGIEVFLAVDSINRPFSVASTLENAEIFTINSSGDYKIGELIYPKNFNIKINSLYGYQVNINALKCIEVVYYDDIEHSVNFNAIDEYVVVDSNFFVGQDSNNFAFRMLGKTYFCKGIEDKIVVKGKCKKSLDYISKSK